MPRPSLPKSEKLSDAVNVKLKRSESQALARLSKARRAGKNPAWTKSAILREAFLKLIRWGHYANSG